MPKYFRKRYSRPSKDKYSVEQHGFNSTVLTSGNLALPIVPPTTTEGMRKVKHLTLSIGTNESSSGFWWAIVYVPQGTTVNPLSVATTDDFYTPSQFVMNCGFIDRDAGPNRIGTPLARNLNEGDSVYLLVKGSPGDNIYGVIRYAITYN